jgi:phosphoglycolate phosphatase-like HAD superfamily hydrolase
MEVSEMPKAAIFDLDGTLLDSVDLHALRPHSAYAIIEGLGGCAVFG